MKTIIQTSVNGGGLKIIGFKPVDDGFLRLPACFVARRVHFQPVPCNHQKSPKSRGGVKLPHSQDSRCSGKKTTKWPKIPRERKTWQHCYSRLPHKPVPLVSLIHQQTLERHRHSAAGGEFLSASKSLFFSAAAFGHVSCLTFWAAAILKLSMNEELHMARQQQRDHAQHTKETGTLGQRS